MKGIILAGGKGSRLSPLTEVCSKQLLPVYDKPMIYYPLSFLMMSGVKDFMVITAPEDAATFEKLLGTGERFGVNIEYKVQPEPTGIPEAFVLAEEFIGDDAVTLILGDNIFYCDSVLMREIQGAIESHTPTIFAHRVSDPGRYGVVEFDKEFNVLSVEEKPKVPKSNYAITGLYIFDKDVVSIAKSLKASNRGETEIIDVIKNYIDRDKLSVELLGRGVAWLDTGTVDSLLDASRFVQTIEKRQGFKIACLEEIAFRKNFITLDQLEKLAESSTGTYKEYLNMIVGLERDS
jgi:glucose-1-phosphate thymidylyltransferase